LKVRVVIRDEWTNQDSAIQESFRRLSELLGVPVVIEPDWPFLVKELADAFDDVSELANSVVACVTAWLRSLVDLLDGNYYPDFASALSKQAKSAGKLQAVLEVGRPRPPGRVRVLR